MFVPSLGLSTRVFLQEHEDEFTMNAFEDSNGKRKIIIQPKTNVVPGMEVTEEENDGNHLILECSPSSKFRAPARCNPQLM